MQPTGRNFLIVCAVLAAGLAVWFLWPREVAPVPGPPRPEIHDPPPQPTHETPPEPVHPVRDPGARPIEAPRPIDASKPHVSGSVHTTGGAPIAGARLEAVFELDGARREQGHTSSGADGNFALELPDWSAFGPLEREGARGFLAVSAEGHQPQRLPFKLLPAQGAGRGDAAELAIVLLPGRTLRGRVLDGADRPVAGAEVALVTRVPAPKETKPLRAVSTHTGADGRFDLGFASSSRLELFVHADNAGVLQREIELEAGADRDLGDLRLVGPAALEGVVLFPNGQPAPDLELWAVPELVAMQPTALALCVARAFENELAGDGLFSTHARTDAQGRFALRGLKSGRYMLRSPRNEVVLEPRIGYYHATTENIRLELQSARLRVRAVDANGRVLSGARVRLTELSELGNGRYQPGQIWNETVGGPLGCATFEVQVETTYGVRVEARGFAVHEDLVMLAQTEFEQLQEYRLEAPGAPGRVQLVLRGALATPPHRAQVELVSALTGATDPDLGPLDCDAEGWLPPLAPGRYLFSVGFKEDVADPNWYLPLLTRDPLELPAGQTRELPLTCEAGARLELALDLAGPPPAGFLPAAPATELTPEQQKLRANERLAQRGAFVDAEGLEGQGTRRLQFWAADGSLESQLLPGNTGKAFELLAPGRWKVTVQAQGFATETGEVALAPGRFNSLRLELRAR